MKYIVLHELIKACFFILMAEMGDKTQILAMAFAAKYSVKNVLAGVTIGSFLNHSLAVILGSYLSSVIPLGAVRLLAACLFIAFGLWSLKIDRDEEETSKEKFGPIATVAIAFFIGELGDKTQLTAITLSTTASYPPFILMGTVLGMVLTSSIGIFVGRKLGKRIPEFTMKVASSVIFIIFGISGLYESTPRSYMTPINISIFMILLITLFSYMFIRALHAVKDIGGTTLKRTADALKKSIQNIKPSVEGVCLGTHNCGSCEGRRCSVGSAKIVLECAVTDENYLNTDKFDITNRYINKRFDKVKEQHAFECVVENCLNCGKEHHEECVINKVREIFEIQCVGEKIYFDGDKIRYKKLLNSIDVPREA
jgi:Ca2+/H+ antiporter, TMEM165/GDT1 family